MSRQIELGFFFGHWDILNVVDWGKRTYFKNSIINETSKETYFNSDARFRVSILKKKKGIIKQRVKMNAYFRCIRRIAPHFWHCKLTRKFLYSQPIFEQTQSPVFLDCSACVFFSTFT